MTKKLEELFNLPAASDNVDDDFTEELVEEQRELLAEVDDAIDKIDSALPAIRDLDASDKEMDELATKAIGVFDDLKDLGFNVDSRYASEIFAVASTMLGHAITAKTAKMNKKLKMISLQLQKAKLDQAALKADPASAAQTGQGMLLDRNELINKLLNRDTKDSK